MNFPRQFLAILSMNLAGVTRRKAAIATIIIGVTSAVGVLVSMLAMGVGAQRQEMEGVRDDHVILITSGTRAGQGNISREEATAIPGLPGIRRGAQGQPIVVFESEVWVQGRRRVTGNRIYFPLVGTSLSLTDYQPEMHLTAGRMFKPGLHELIASNACVRQFTGFDVGDARAIHGSDWIIVGHFDQSLAQQCSVYGDVDGIMSAFSRNTYGAASVRLQSPADFDAFRDAVAANPVLHLEARREREVIEDDFKQLNSILNFVSYFVGTIMAIAATLGAVNSLYAIVELRGREIATVLCTGF
jgi:putative ABC transport system permease protein